MLNGKFYTGLTANQMNRTRGPDRQKSNFFWPDETDAEPPVGRKNTPRQNNNRSSFRNPTPEKEDIKPKELFHKQLTSKIEFCDPLPQTPVARRNSSYKSTSATSTPKYINNSNDSFTKPDTFSSKIEFYDYPDSGKKSVNSTPIISRPDEEFQKMSDRKKITFDDKYAKKGILKNNEVRTSPQEHQIPIEHFPNYKKNNVPRRNLSKSVENIPKLGQMSPDYKISNGAGLEKEVNAIMEEMAPLHVTDTPSPSPNKTYYTTGTSPSARNNYNYDESPKMLQKSKKITRNDYGYQDNHGTNNNSYTHEETSNGWTDQNGYHHRTEHSEHRQSFNNSKSRSSTGEPKRYANQDRYYQQDDDARYAKGITTMYDTPPKSTTKYIPIEVVGAKDEYNSNSRYSKKNDDVRESVPAAGMRRTNTPAKYGGGGGVSNNNQPQQQQQQQHYPNEAAVRAHSHLKSNIFFMDDNKYGGDDRPRSVRESAVSRVGVGLPNI